MDKYRHELKYICSQAEVEELKIRTSAVAEPDPHTVNGSYLIRSLYFDDYDNSAYGDNESGVDPREKWRIRIYNGNSDRIQLECKRKQNGMINKKSCPITKKEYADIVSGSPALSFDDRALFNRFKIQRETKLLHPVVIVQYVRYPYICRDGNVRITLDCDIASSGDIARFLDPELSCRPIQDRNRQLLEVKYDEFLPDEIYHAVQLKNRRQQTFSKYYLCRRYFGGILK